MYSFRIREDGHGIYYALTYKGEDYYIHKFSFPTREEAASAAFDHMLLRVYWDSILGRSEYFFNGRQSNAK